MTTRDRAFALVTGIGLLVAVASFGVVAFNHVAIAKRGIYWACLEDSGIGDGAGFVTWVPHLLPTGYLCTLNGRAISFHDIGTPFMVAGIASIVLIVALALVRRAMKRSRANISGNRAM